MPQAILLTDVEALGERGAVVEVSKGYLRNYLEPRKLAQPATPGAIAAASQRVAAASALPSRPSSRPRRPQSCFRARY